MSISYIIDMQYGYAVQRIYNGVLNLTDEVEAYLGTVDTGSLYSLNKALTFLTKKHSVFEQKAAELQLVMERGTDSPYSMSCSRNVKGDIAERQNAVYVLIEAVQEAINNFEEDISDD